MSTPTKPWEVDAQERSRRARSLLVQRALWAPSMAERDIISARLRPLVGQGRQLPNTSSRQRSWWCGAPKRTDGATAAVVSTKHKS